MASYKPKHMKMKMAKMAKMPKPYKAAGQGVGQIKPKVKPTKVKSHKLKP